MQRQRRIKRLTIKLKNWLRKKGINDISNVNIPIGKSLVDTYDKRPEIISAHIISEMLSIIEKKAT